MKKIGIIGGIMLPWVLLALLFLAGVGGYQLRRIVLIGTAYKAKSLCSAMYVSGREEGTILGEDLGSDQPAILRYVGVEVDEGNRSVSAALFGLARRKAVFREGLGCTLLLDGDGEGRLARVEGVRKPPPPSEREGLPWPQGEAPGGVSPSLDQRRFRAALDEAFSEPDPQRLRRTRGVVVVHGGRIVAERYAPGFSGETPLPGWSMTKGAFNALTGIMVGRGRLSLTERALLPEWRAAGDPRAGITLDHLLRMESGLRFREEYDNPLGDVIRMLYAEKDTAAFAAAKPPEAKPGSRWHYSSGSTNIISRIIRDRFVGREADYLAFPRRALFDRIGMRSAIIEPDASGTLVGSSFMFAGARDWARLGLLYLREGVWEGERILPPGWVRYSVTPARRAPEGEYGAHLWLKIPSFFRGRGGPLPADAFHMIGHEGQFVSVIPSRDLVVVRLGLTRKEGAWDHEAFLSSILEALPDGGRAGDQP